MTNFSVPPSGRWQWYACTSVYCHLNPELQAENNNPVRVTDSHLQSYLLPQPWVTLLLHLSSTCFTLRKVSPPWSLSDNSVNEKKCSVLNPASPHLKRSDPLGSDLSRAQGQNLEALRALALRHGYPLPQTYRAPDPGVEVRYWGSKKHSGWVDVRKVRLSKGP